MLQLNQTRLPSQHNTNTQLYDNNQFKNMSIGKNSRVIKSASDTTTYKVYISWSDSYDNDKKRPNSIKVALLANGENYGDIITITDEYSSTTTQWTYTFENLPKMMDGKTVTYKACLFEEIPYYSNSTAYYNGYSRLTLTHQKDQVNITVIKIWDDNDNQDNKRPYSSLKIYVEKNNQSNSYITLYKTSNWTASKVYDKYTNGILNNYTLIEPSINSYVLSNITNQTSEYLVIRNNLIYNYTNMTFTLTNKHIPETRNITVIKVWDDYDNKDNTRADHVTVNLLANNETVNNVTLSSSNNWTYTFESLPKYASQKIINYNFMEEDIPEGYVAKISYKSDNYTITNRYVTQVNVSAVWVDANNRDKARPYALYIQLNKNGKVYKTTWLSESNNWKYTFNELEIYDEEGNLNEYTLTHSDYDLYISQITESSQNFVISYTYVSKITVHINKIWNDSNDNDGLRPSQIQVKLLANGVQYGDLITIDKSNNWTINVTNLPKYIDDKLINYSVEEIVPEGYAESYSVDKIVEIKNSSNINVECINVSSTDVRFKIYVTDNTHELIRNGNITVYTEDNLVYASGSLSEGYVQITWPIDEDFNVRIEYSGYEEYTSNTSYFDESIVYHTWAGSNGILPWQMSDKLWGYCMIYSAYDPSMAMGYDENDEAIYMPYGRIALTNESIINTRTNEDVLQYIRTLLFYHSRDSENFTLMSNGLASRINNPLIFIYLEDTEYGSGRFRSIHYEDPSTYWRELYPREEYVLIENNQLISEGKGLANHGVIGQSDGGLIVYQFYKYNHLISGFWQDLICLEISLVPEETQYIINITNTHVPLTDNYTVIKLWDDNDDEDQLRPQSITVNLLKNGTVYDSTVLDESNDWMCRFENLPVYENASLINYTIEEVEVPGYVSNVIDKSHIFMITNYHNSEKVSVNVTKVWNDTENNDGKRPENVKIHLLADDIEIDNVLLDKSNNWTYTFKNLPKYNKNNLVAYNIIEDEIDEYTTSIINCNYSFKVINTYICENTSVYVHKTWIDNDNQDALRPDEITVKLYSNKKEYITATIGKSDNWTIRFDNLPKYYDNGKLVEYSVVEIEPQGYNSSITQNFNEFTLENIHIPEVISMNITKIWDDYENQDGLRPDNITIYLLADENIVQSVVLNKSNWSYSFNNLQKYYKGIEINYTIDEESVDNYTTTLKKCNSTISMINHHKVELINLTTHKVWVDNNNQDNIRPEQVQVMLMADNQYINMTTLTSNNNWTYTFQDLPRYKNANEIIYTVEELLVPQGYDVDYNQDTLTITNTHEVLTKEINVVKAWIDDNNNDNLRPTKVTLELYADGILTNSVVLNDSNWSYCFTKLPVYRSGKVGEKINYTIIERPVEYYTTHMENVDDNYTITNIHEITTINISVCKVWVDNDNQDIIRPQEAIIYIYADNKIIDEIKLNENNNWSYTLRKLPKYNNGIDVNYTLSELNVNGYTSHITKNNSEFTVTNTHVPEVVKVDVTKIWDDYEDNDGIRSDSVKVQLYADAVEIDSIIVLNNNNNWTYTWNDLPKYNGKHEIIYTVDEVNTSGGYVKSVSNTNNSYIIVNSHDLITTSFNVSKIWDDDNNQDGLRPPEVHVDLLSNGIIYRHIILDSMNNWTYTFENLPKYSDAKLINYTVREVDFNPHYEKVIVQEENSAKIVNTHVPGMINISIRKIWIDDNDNDGLRPESVEVNLLANCKEYKSISLNSKNNWTYTCVNIPEYHDGSKINYTLEEANIPHEYTSCINNYTIINTHISKTANITISKKWIDNNNNDGLRPSSVRINLYADDMIINSSILSTSNNWSIIYRDLPVYHEGKTIHYSVDEENISNYTCSIVYDEGTFIITNTHNDSTINCTITKLWVDDNNRDGLRPDNITVCLFADNKKHSAVVITANEEWKYTFKNLPEYNDGKKIIYTIDELNIPLGYMATVNNTTLINTHEICTKEVKVCKIWDDNDNNDNLRPKNVSVVLYADKIAVGNPVTLNEDNNWSHLFKNLNLYNEGKLISYTVDEINNTHRYRKVIYDNSDVFIIANTHELETVTLKIFKEWNDNNNSFDKRPNNISLDILADGIIIDSITLNAQMGWKIEINHLPKYDNGNSINYSIVEDKIPYYNTSIISYNNSFNISNTLKVYKKFLWSWKLIGINESYYTDKLGSYELIIHKNDNQIVKTSNKICQYSGVDKKYYKQRTFKHCRKSPRDNKFKMRYHLKYMINKLKYKLFIYLYKDFFFGNMSYDDFIVILKEKGITLSESTVWNSGGVSKYDYDNLDDIPDSIMLEDSKGRVASSYDNVEKHKTISDTGIIDEGKIEVDILEE